VSFTDTDRINFLNSEVAAHGTVSFDRRNAQLVLGEEMRLVGFSVSTQHVDGAPSDPDLRHLIDNMMRQFVERTHRK
jgi:hypothetical protein